MMEHSTNRRPSRPEWLTWPNAISAARMVLLLPLSLILIEFPADPFWRRVAFGLFLVMAVSDALDGYLARRLGQQSRAGFVLDPLADKLLIAVALVLLAIPATAVPGHRVPWWVPAIVIGKDIVVTLGLAALYLKIGRGLDRPRLTGKVCTLFQLVLVGLVLAAPDLPSPVVRTLPTVWWMASGLAVAAVIDYFIAGIQADRRESTRLAQERSV
ncbi:MAG: CDP-alcohol phosphatidyltransferase family protein [Phycisphaerae bacterium]|nr:CDP-alcohol phosphatidyltransferase family protein [Phycisphaerae bacterium]